MMSTGFSLEEKWPEIHNWFFGPMMRVDGFKKIYTEAVPKL